MTNVFIGEIRIYGFGFAPRGMALCNGQIMQIAQNTALFSLLGTTYGGNGQTTFGLPNLQSRVPLHQGQGPGLSQYVLGEETGTETVTLLQSQMPSHNHLANASNNDPTDATPQNNVPANIPAGGYAATANTNMNPSMIGLSGGNQPHANLQPLLVLNFCIALVGIFPSRN
jgi:microcystin-dependent protein